MTQPLIIIIPWDFSKYPGGRYRSDGPDSGERLRDDFLAPALARGETVTVRLDGALGYGSGFLEEAFGGLVRECGFSNHELYNQLVLETDDASLACQIRRYIFDAAERKLSA